MERRKVTGYNFPKKLSEIPYPIIEPGYLLDINAGFRTTRPVLDNDNCVKCLMCYVICPEGAIYREGEKILIDYDYCKGCGVCVHECNRGAIQMISEEK